MHNSFHNEKDHKDGCMCYFVIKVETEQKEIVIPSISKEIDIGLIAN